MTGAPAFDRARLLSALASLDEALQADLEGFITEILRQVRWS